MDSGDVGNFLYGYTQYSSKDSSPAKYVIVAGDKTSVFSICPSGDFKNTKPHYLSGFDNYKPSYPMFLFLSARLNEGHDVYVFSDSRSLYQWALNDD